MHALHEPARHLHVERLGDVAAPWVAEPPLALPLELEDALDLLGRLGLWLHPRRRTGRRGAGPVQVTLSLALPVRGDSATRPRLCATAAPASAAAPPSASSRLPRLRLRGQLVGCPLRRAGFLGWCGSGRVAR